MRRWSGASQRDTGAMLDRLTPADQSRLIAAMTTIETLLGGEPGQSADDRAPAICCARRCRAISAGSSNATAELYAQEYQWTEPFEGLCAQIVADFANKSDPKRERCWIAEMDGENVGCDFPGQGAGEPRPHPAACWSIRKRAASALARKPHRRSIRFARRAGYKKITLWTHSVLTAARHIYQKAGFKLTRSEKHKSWGRPVVSEHWDLEL